MVEEAPSRGFDVYLFAGPATSSRSSVFDRASDWQCAERKVVKS